MGINSLGRASSLETTPSFRRTVSSFSPVDALPPATEVSRVVTLVVHGALDVTLVAVVMPNWIGKGVINDTDGATSKAARNVLDKSIQRYDGMDAYV